MSETTPPPLPTQSSNSRSPEKTPLTKDSALEVPQILEMIFSNLTSHQIRQSVLPVCYQWHIIAQPHAFRSIAWCLDKGASDDDSCHTLYEHIFGATGSGQGATPLVDPLKYLGVAQRLVTRADRREPASGIPFEWKSSFSPASWQALLGVITDTPYLLNLLDLQVLCPIDFVLEAFELLRHIGSLLTKLRLEVSRRDGTLLDTTLSLCPKLEQLTVEFSCFEEDFIEELYRKPWSPPVSQAIPLAHPSVRSLTLRRVAMDEESLLRLVDMCPGLEDLVLDQVFGAIDNEVEMQDGSATTELVQATIVPLFSEVTAWVFPATSTLEVAEICGWSNSFFDLPRVTMLTSLEILVRYSGVEPLNLGFNLHNYLCSPLLSQHLVQLKAPGVMIPLDCLDMEGVLDSNGAYRKPDPTLWSLMPDDVLGNSRTMIWGCRNLRTLHIQVQCPKGDIRSAASSRLVFGYISKVCPALEELRLQKEHLDLSMEGGLCLLARLDQLKSLALAARDGVWEPTPGLDWIAHELSSRQSNEMTKFIDQNIAEEVFNPVYRHHPLDYQAPAAPGTPSLRHTNAAFVRGREANAGDHGRDGWGHGTDASVSAEVSTVPNYVIDGIDMRYLGQLQGVVEDVEWKHGLVDPYGVPRDCQKERLPNVFVGTAVRAQVLVCQMRPDIEFNTFWR
ncbi:hypothetical protein EC957_012434 [Mortierella hygrophila]|uniref:F-box domain-containing protein n=1 Tax=Mortierella hygrophila TaxID=979708 RepID=A0A9P6F7H1_9FUNG|nr:hypothetical protein EC957_012434 [Mortierella hygrophila]